MLAPANESHPVTRECALGRKQVCLALAFEVRFASNSGIDYRGHRLDSSAPSRSQLISKQSKPYQYAKSDAAVVMQSLLGNSRFHEQMARENGQKDCTVAHAVQIEPSLRP
jgi:hypothetical protein